MPSLGRRLFLGFIALVIVVVGGAIGYWIIGGGPGEPIWKFGDHPLKASKALAIVDDTLRRRFTRGDKMNVTTLFESARL